MLLGKINETIFVNHQAQNLALNRPWFPSSITDYPGDGNS